MLLTCLSCDVASPSEAWIKENEDGDLHCPRCDSVNDRETLIDESE